MSGKVWYLFVSLSLPPAPPVPLTSRMQAPSGLSRVQGHRGVSAQWKLSSPAQPLSCSASQWLPLSHSLPLASHHRHRRQHQWEWPSRRSAQAASAAACVASAPAVPLVSEGWGLWALLALGGACAQVATRHAVGRALSTPLIALIYGVVLTATGVLPSDCVSFDVVWQVSDRTGPSMHT